MATNDPEKMTLQLLVDKENNRVVFAEASKDFIDVLFSFLTLPVGTVVRLLGDESELGCMRNLYRSVENLEEDYFGDKQSKMMLLRPRNSAADECRKLKVNIDDTEPARYFVCQKFSSSHCDEALSNFSNSRCGCGTIITREMLLTENKVDNENGVFLKGKSSFMITDDLQVMPLSSETTFGLLNKLGVRAIEVLEKITVTVNLEKVSSLLKHALVSGAPLTDTFLLDQKKLSTICRPIQKREPTCRSTKFAEDKAVQKIQLTVVVQKSTSKTIYAEAQYDFINSLMSFLTVPLVSVVKLLDRASSLGCITNLYKSVEGLNSDQYMKSDKHKEMLLSPQFAPQQCCENQLLGLMEANPPYFYNVDTNCRASLTTSSLCWFSTGCPYSKRLDFVKMKALEGPTVFMVTDDLVVTPFSSISTITLLQQLKIPIDDIEKHAVSIGHDEALRILEASMTSSRALTSILKDITEKKLKQEKC